MIHSPRSATTKKPGEAQVVPAPRYFSTGGELLSALGAERSYLVGGAGLLRKALGGGWEEIFPDGPVEPEPVAYLPF
jgi:hypothetical protein